MSALTTVHGLSAVLGNGSVLTVISRFKSLRTFPNILIANLSVVDLLNAVINMPIFMISTVWETRWFKGKTLAIMTSFFNRLFTISILRPCWLWWQPCILPLRSILRFSPGRQTRKPWSVLAWSGSSALCWHRSWWRSCYWIPSGDLQARKVFHRSVHGTLQYLLWSNWFPDDSLYQEEENQGMPMSYLNEFLLPRGFFSLALQNKWAPKIKIQEK